MAKINFTPIFILIGIAVAVFLLMIKISPPDNFLEVKLYDENQHLIGTNEFAVVAGLESVKFISIKINIKNTDSEVLSTTVTQLTPYTLDKFKPQGELLLETGERGSLETDLIDVALLGRDLHEYCITIKSDSPSLLRDPQTRTDCFSLDIQDDSDSQPYSNETVGEDEIIIDADPQDPEINLGCDELWQCEAWSECIFASDLQTRICEDLNDCGTFDDKPITEQFCATPYFLTTAFDGNYRVSGVTITLGELVYTYNGYGSFGCDLPSATIILTTPEGFPICSREGYDVSDRVYLDDGRGNIFKT